MDTKSQISDKTISDFGDQWGRYTKNEGWYASRALFEDIVQPLLTADDIRGASVADIGSGTGRIIGMLLACDAKKVYAIEPSPDAFRSLTDNLKTMQRGDDVVCLNCRGDEWSTPEPLDLVLSIGVIHHIPEPAPVLRVAYDALRPGGRVFLWLYGHEGNETYLRIVQPLRSITTRLPHVCLTATVELLYAAIVCYRTLLRFLPLPLRSYIVNVFWRFSPANRRLVIYDQLNPTYAKYYRQDEAIRLLTDAGFMNVRAHHRHGYSWSVIGEKPA